MIQMLVARMDERTDRVKENKKLILMLCSDIGISVSVSYRIIRRKFDKILIYNP